MFPIKHREIQKHIRDITFSYLIIVYLFKLLLFKMMTICYHDITCYSMFSYLVITVKIMGCLMILIPI